MPCITLRNGEDGVARIFALLRLIRLYARSAGLRLYLRLAYPGVRCHSSVRFGHGARVRAFAGGTVTIGRGAFIADFALVEAFGGELSIGENCQIGRGTTVVCRESVTIGDGALIAEYVTIRDQDHRHEGNEALAAQGFVTAPIVIGHDVWIGAKVTVTRGVTIAPHSVAGAHAVVTQSVAERAVVAGVPARQIGGR